MLSIQAQKSFYFFSRENRLLPWSEHQNIEAGMQRCLIICANALHSTINYQYIEIDQEVKKQSRRNSSTMLPTMSRLEPGKRDIILLNLDVKVFSYFFPPHSSLAHVTNFM